MTYELAKQLKDAGFPRKSWDGFALSAPGNQVSFPTLSELIEACMDFYSPAHFEMGGWKTWWAILRNENNIEALVPVQSGQTPEEAVAKLWLALNKKG